MASTLRCLQALLRTPRLKPCTRLRISTQRISACGQRNSTSYISSQRGASTKVQRTTNTDSSSSLDSPHGDDFLASRAEAFSGELSSTFEDPHVKGILWRIVTQDIHLEKVFPVTLETVDKPTYETLTEEELKRENERITQEAKARLSEIPRVRSERHPIDVVLSDDTDSREFDKEGCDFVFMDISTGNLDLGEAKCMRDRRVVVRENHTGVLREATWDERDHMQFLYYPIDQLQDMQIKPFLKAEYLPKVLANEQHEYALDMINIQYEPDHPDYIRVYMTVYGDILHRKLFDSLFSTRHYPGFVHYIVTNNHTNELLSFMLSNHRYANAVDLAKLHLYIHEGTIYDETSFVEESPTHQLSDEHRLGEIDVKLSNSGKFIRKFLLDNNMDDIWKKHMTILSLMPDDA